MNDLTILNGSGGDGEVIVILFVKKKGKESVGLEQVTSTV